ncbi:MAG: glycerate kinase [Promethearchaeota archaeon]
MQIKNTTELLRNDLDENELYLRKVAIKALEKAIGAVKPKSLIKNSIKIQDNILTIQNDEYDLEKYNKIYIIGGGKATAEMGLTLEKILSNFKDIEYEGIINVPQDSVKSELFEVSKIKINFASHPIPDERGLKGTKQIIDLVKKSYKNDLILCLLSGGGSALLTLPRTGISLTDLQTTNSLLLASGASIHEINTIRKHLSDFKGGNLAKFIYELSGATLISIIISDVVGNKLDSIASGPTVPDSTNFKDAIGLLEKYKIFEKIPKSVRNHLKEGVQNSKQETPKSDDECFQNVHNYLVGSVKIAVNKLIPFLTLQDFQVFFLSDEIVGEAKKYGRSLYNIIFQKIEETSKETTPYKIALVGSGELTVTIEGKGIGGRNQEMLLSFLDFIKRKEFPYDFLILGANLDGIEGNSKAMGALIDNYVLTQIKENKIDTKKYLNNNDSNSFFNLVGTAVITGPTGCNVNDLLLVLLHTKKF